MTTGTSALRAPGSSHFFGKLSRSWLWILLLGVLFILMGIAGLSMTVAFTIGTMLFIGIAILITGFLQLLHVLQCSNWRGAVWHLFIAVFYIVVGGSFMNDPEIASIFITPILGSSFIAIGVLRLMMGLQLRPYSNNWFLISLSAIFSIVLGGLILAQWPDASLWTIGMMVAIELLLQGIAYILIGIAAKPVSQ